MPGPDTSRANRYPAVLLFGPTGCGKTPLGQLLEAEGLWGRRCVHFDFGMALRQCATASARGCGTVTPDERAFLQQVLETGALLEDEHFPIARKVLLDFLARRGADSQTMIVLNGLPRHVGQAEALEAIVAVEAVVHLVCEPEVAVERIRSDAGGDRNGRADDALAAVRARIETFDRRTLPLLDHYRARGVRIIRADVGVTTTSHALRAQLERESA